MCFSSLGTLPDAWEFSGSVLHIILAVPRIEFFRRETSDAVLGICWIHSSTLWSEIQIMSQDEMINLYIGRLSTCDCDKNPWSDQWCSWDQEKSTATTQALITKCKVLLKTSDYEEIPRLQQQNQQLLLILLELRGMQCLKDTSGAKSSGSAANVLFNISISVSN